MGNSWIGPRLRQLREDKGLTPGDIERSTGMLRAYTSRIERGHAMPSLESLERFAAALEIPLYELFRDTTGPEREQPQPASEKEKREEAFFLVLKRCVHDMNHANRRLLLSFVRQLARQQLGAQEPAK